MAKRRLHRMHPRWLKNTTPKRLKRGDLAQTKTRLEAKPCVHMSCNSSMFNGGSSVPVFFFLFLRSSDIMRVGESAM